jgi:hypothetical protein
MQRLTASLKKLDLALVFFGGFAGFERAQISALAGLLVFFDRIYAVFAGF